MKKPKAPKNLKAEGRKFWNRVTAEYDFEAEHDFVRLAQAAGCLDVIKAAEDRVEKIRLSREGKPVGTEPLDAE